jgi:predicted ArsR family transcriptional regulator
MDRTQRVKGGIFMTEDTLRKQLYGSFKNRAMMYYHIYKELQEEIGEARAAAIMKRAITRRGLEIGKQFAAYSPADLQGLKGAFLAFIPDEGRVFAPEVQRCDSEGLDIKFHRCPLKEAWQEAGLPEEEVAKLCEIAAAVDIGTFQGAGFRFSAETWQPGGKGCCHLHIRPGE